MKRVDRYLIEALVLIGLGILFLLQNLGILGGVAGLIWALAFTAGGVAFLVVFLRNSGNWWAAIPGSTLLGIGALIGLDELIPAHAGSWGGALVLGMISLGFWLVYLTGRQRWWAVIPGGVLLTLAAVASLTENTSGMDLGWVFFLGLGLTFGLVAMLPTPDGHMRWALIPAAIMMAMALLILAVAEPIFNVLWPLLLIVGGIALIWRRAKGAVV